MRKLQAGGSSRLASWFVARIEVRLQGALILPALHLQLIHSHRGVVHLTAHPGIGWLSVVLPRGVDDDDVVHPVRRPEPLATVCSCSCLTCRIACASFTSPACTFAASSGSAFRTTAAFSARFGATFIATAA